MSVLIDRKARPPLSAYQQADADGKAGPTSMMTSKRKCPHQVPSRALGLRDVAVEDAGGAQGGGLADGDVGVVEPLEHVLPGELEQPDGPEVEAAQRLQHQACQRAAMQFACETSGVSINEELSTGSSQHSRRKPWTALMLTIRRRLS